MPIRERKHTLSTIPADECPSAPFATAVVAALHGQRFLFGLQTVLEEDHSSLRLSDVRHPQIVLHARGGIPALELGIDGDGEKRTHEPLRRRRVSGARQEQDVFLFVK